MRGTIKVECSVMTQRSHKSSHREPDLAAYAGKWVALSRKRIVAVGSSLPDVMRKLPSRPSPLTPSLFLVPRRDEGPYVLLIS